jgi:hypothetical protein
MGYRNGADADVGQMALNFHGRATLKLPEDFRDFLFAWAEYFEESFRCHATAPLHIQRTRRTPHRERLGLIAKWLWEESKTPCPERSI